jgi:hypothetical protein
LLRATVLTIRHSRDRLLRLFAPWPCSVSPPCRLPGCSGGLAHKA